MYKHRRFLGSTSPGSPVSRSNVFTYPVIMDAKIIYLLIECVVTPPTITKQPTDVTIQALQHATFTCEASGFGVKYEWKRHKNSNIIGTQSNLTISRATPLNEGQYYCVAMTEGGYAFSNNVTLSVDGENHH